MQKNYNPKVKLFMEFFAKEMGATFHNIDTGEIIGLNDEGELDVIGKEGE